MIAQVIIETGIPNVNINDIVGIEAKTDDNHWLIIHKNFTGEVPSYAIRRIKPRKVKFANLN